MNKVIWVIHQYASTPNEGMGGRWFYLSQELVKKGWAVYIFCSSNHHLLRTKKEINSAEDCLVEDVDGINMVWIPLMSYSNPHSIKRVMGWFEFVYKVIKLSCKIKSNPYSIVVSSPSLLSFLAGRILAKKYASRLLLDVRDIWPLTLVELGGIKKYNPLIIFMNWVEKIAYKKSDIVISNLKGAKEHFIKKGCAANKIKWIPNGFCSEEITFEKSTLYTKKMPHNKFIVGYVGTHGFANSLDLLIDAAHRLALKEKEVHFVLAGSGKEKVKLVEKVQSLGLTNVTFLEPVPKQDVYSLLNAFDVCYIGSKTNSIYRFGIGANKIPEYMCSGKPIIHSYSGCYDPVKISGGGVTFDTESASDLVSCILSFYNKDRGELKLIGESGKKYAKEHFDYRVLGEEIERLLFKEESKYA